ncbi:Calsyntenin-1 [Fasciolopsis buskii]|uniref:Calsyntenin-1 n=1 Tax=Fasciolopsis buskii TaxID=27845 RepID=A0A8E0RVF5_9TREM|nr:Calsyntenin-1 [Fasciolopsis buski]
MLASSKSQITWNFDSDPGSIFHGYIIEKNQEISVYPPLHVQLAPGSKLCHLHLLPTATHSVPKFVSTEILDAERGYAKLVLNESALYEERLRGEYATETGVFHLKVVGEDCNHPHHRTKPWAINLLLVPTEKPVWSERQYSFQVDSNLPAGGVVGKVTAYAALDPERGLENRLGDDTGMCNYAINHPDNNLFDINGHGVIRSRIPLERHSGKRFSINVTAFDCHIPVPRRATVAVSVFVRSNCTIEWNGKY